MSIDHAVTSANHLIGSASPNPVIRQTQAAVNAGLDAVASGVQSLRDDTASIARAADAAELQVHRSLQSVRQSTRELIERARSGSLHAQEVIRHDPFKAVLIAAAAGIAVAALIGLFSHSPRRR
jgi:ElaB/YqjD/DUF883 family membrane-anchored ribosome-binding protein